MSLHDFPPSDEPTPRSMPDDELLASLHLPPVTVQLVELADRLRAAAGDSPDFGDVEISRDRTRLIVRWHGRLPAAVQAVVDDPGVPEVEVVVEQTRFPVGELRAEADRLIRLPSVTGVRPDPGGDGIDVDLIPRLVEAAGSPEAAAAAHRVTSRFPLTLRARAMVGMRPMRPPVLEPGPDGRFQRPGVPPGGQAPPA
ncbi:MULTISPECIES: hypothetical protein [unclassified Modestobacter]